MLLMLEVKSTRKEKTDMIKSFIKDDIDFNLSYKAVENGQVFLTLSVINEEGNAFDICTKMYDEIARILIENHISVFHERIFGSLSLYDRVLEIRSVAYKNHHLESDIPFTYVEGNPYWGKGLAGINIQGVILKEKSYQMSNITYKNSICGRTWEDEDAQYILLHSIHADQVDTVSYEQTLEMYEKANDILKENGYEFKHVVRTWIYLHEILKQYETFNKARNIKFREFELIPKTIEDNLYEQVYMPASTGIEGNNSFQAAGVMDVLAIKKKNNSNISIKNENGTNQKSAYRYGSAFSRAMIVDSNPGKYIYLSGTASINEKGETVFLNDIENQIEMTGDVIKALVKKENFDFRNLSEGTVFLKKPEFIKEYRDFSKKNGLDKMPCIITVADVCRDNLLFEMDATFIGD